jgi:hypothetical protein|tara:strand:+ start:1636 stop:1848 length:213 start_codon:yes stop_codon:yes gene_type:complete
MDKVYITKDELTNSIHKQREKAGPLVTTLIVLALCVSVVWLIPLMVFWVLFLMFCIPFYLLDKYIFNRRK